MFNEILPWAVNVIDIIIVAVIIYWALKFLKGSRAERVVLGLAVIVIVYFVSARLELSTLNWMLSNILGSIVIVIIVVFQQDIRRALMQVGRPFFSRDRGVDTGYVEEVSRGAISLSTSKTGGLIVMEKSVDLSAYFDTGVVIDAEISRELLLTIFNNNSPIHDGAVIVSKGRLFKAGCILPLTEKELARGLGTRHRAAVGLSEETDAVIVVISEKTGGISIVNEEKIDLGVEPTSVPGRLKRLLLPGGEGKKGLMSWRFRG